ncbi:hypothetical protein NST84_06700 [Paenibacillus sp. FSL R7-0345]|uniref:hypothetical protein n=1 Tax=Paenibacillus sp. FSL R7-0345 TaxID=2954535 RepID=UPI00315A5BF9
MPVASRRGGYLSLIAHNPAAEVMKKAILNKDPDSALAAIGNSQEYSGLIQTDYTVILTNSWRIG